MKIRFISYDVQGAAVFDNWADVQKEIARYQENRIVRISAVWPGLGSAGLDAVVLIEERVQRRWVNAYEVEQRYGGPEEGGWWYDSGEPLASIPVDTDAEGDTVLDKIRPVYLKGPVNLPTWLGDAAFHRSHQSNLLRKDAAHYDRYFPGVPHDLPYVWPVPSTTNEERTNGT